MSSGTRIRRSLQEIQYNYDNNVDRITLENLVRAFRYIHQLPPDDPNSFNVIAGYHGEPFHGDADGNEDYWGGYCNHGNVLFPTWHRTYLLRLEDALRSAPGCEDVTLPFWDECITQELQYPFATIPTRAPVPTPPLKPIPTILTQPTFTLDGQEIKNPLYSYKFQQAVADAPGANNRYSKPVGYQTVRYPLSGLVGTEEDRKATELHNAEFSDGERNTSILNNNILNWLTGDVQITPPPDTAVPDTTSVFGRFVRCLNAPNYTTFSNKVSAGAWTKSERSRHPGYGNASRDDSFVVALEDPHNAIHLAVGGFYQPGVYDASPIPGANGDMGENETAGFDPIFFFHHCFIDCVFWLWQRRKGCTAEGQLNVIQQDPPYPGTISTGLYEQPEGTALNMQTPLHPFKKPDGTFYTSNDVTDIVNQLGYDYAVSSLDRKVPLGEGEVEATAPPIVAIKRISNINRLAIAGSFVVRMYAETPSGQKFEIGRDAVLSRWSVDNCANCQGNLQVESLVPVHEALRDILKGYVENEEDIKYVAEVTTRAGVPLPWTGAPGLPDRQNAPTVDDL